jgi:hypothetical protein
VEGDAKLVVETLLKNTDDVSWDIAGIISDALLVPSLVVNLDGLSGMAILLRTCWLNLPPNPSL